MEEALTAGPRRRGVEEDLAHRAKGYTAEAEGHVHRVGIAAPRRWSACSWPGPAPREAIHEAVLAVKLKTPLTVLADTIHAFPTVARVMGGVFARAARELGAD